MDTIESLRLHEVVQALKQIVILGRESAQVDTGDEIADDSYRHGTETICCDIDQLISELEAGMALKLTETGSERPYIPIGFKIQAVVTH